MNSLRSLREIHRTCSLPDFNKIRVLLKNKFFDKIILYYICYLNANLEPTKKKDTRTMEKITVQAGKKIWSEPEITLLSVTDNTLGVGAPGSDGLSLS